MPSWVFRRRWKPRRSTEVISASCASTPANRFASRMSASHKGSEIWKRGRIQKHYAAMRLGDLVVGYQATPDKRIVAIAKVSKIASPVAR